MGGQKDSELLFPSKKGNAAPFHSATNSFARAVADAGLNPPNVDRRHKVVSSRHWWKLAGNGGRPLHVIGEMVGHSSPDMTSARPRARQKSQTVNLVRGIFFQGGQATETVKRRIPRNKKDIDIAHGLLLSSVTRMSLFRPSRTMRTRRSYSAKPHIAPSCCATSGSTAGMTDSCSFP